LIDSRVQAHIHARSLEFALQIGADAAELRAPGQRRGQVYLPAQDSLFFM
jgi:hypothetical protein